MWKPKCCTTESSDIDSFLSSSIELYRRDKQNKVVNGITESGFISSVKILDPDTIGFGYVKHNSLAAQETAIQKGIDPINATQFIFKYFPVQNYIFNEIRWSGSVFDFQGSQKLARVTLNNGKNRKTFVAEDSAPFISLIGYLRGI